MISAIGLFGCKILAVNYGEGIAGGIVDIAGGSYEEIEKAKKIGSFFLRSGRRLNCRRYN